MTARPLALLLACFPVGLVAGCEGDGVPPALVGDADGDFISDELEGANEAPPRDTDGDGLPDFRDLDSDRDGIPDALEAGDLDLASSPVDSDGDGDPDFVDGDADGNGIPDWVEGPDDTLGFGIPDFQSVDDDQDGLLDVDELAGILDPPMDSDGDGRFNYQDADSDDDGILDGHERLTDADGDGLPNAVDLDSDGDGLLDRDEAGDLDVRTVPVDTDGDGAPDFLDLDSDDDGLSDAREVELGTSTTSDDSDGDGVPDLIEVVACFDPATGCETFAIDPTRSPRTEGNFVFVVPFEDDPIPPRDTLRFATDIRQADVYLLMDTTCSMGGAISSLKESLSREPDGLIAKVRDTIPEAWYGVGDFRDYTVTPYGSEGEDYAYNHIQDMTPDAEVAQDAVDSLDRGFGNDAPESQVPAMFAVATGQGLPGKATIDATPLPARTDCPRGTFGYPCFRERAVPVMVMMSDVVFHNGPNGANPYDNAIIGGPAITWEQSVAGVTGRRVNFLGIAVNGGGRDHQEAYARAVGSTDQDGNPFVNDWSTGTPISDVVVEQIQTLAEQTRFDVTLEYQDGPEDAVDTYAAFVDHIEAVPGGTVADCPFRVPVDTDSDGFADTFFNVGARSGVCFDVVVKENQVIEAGEEPQLFRATLRVVGDNFTDLDVRDIYFLVPPDPELALPR